MNLTLSIHRRSFEPVRNRFSRSKELPEHLRRGVRGEKLLADSCGITATKFFTAFRDPTGGEIDIVCRDGTYSFLSK